MSTAVATQARGFGRGRGRGGGRAPGDEWGEVPNRAVTAPPPVAASAVASNVAPPPSPFADEEPTFCLVCAEPIALFCVTPCGHNDVCGMCISRLRMLGRDRACLLCKAQHDHCVVSRVHHGQRTAYADFGIYGDLGGPSLVLDDVSGLFFHVSAEADRLELGALRQYRCGVALPGGGGSCATQCGSLQGLTR